ncbi:hypothetical protein [Streptosporangium sp. NPDC051022]|uniref:hypothetical protein n=1 Tax=Streptosporangium sp. NPDC051022 TaxID=3155752 RepID=UPI0034495CC6
MSWRYTGDMPATYPAYIDQATGQTLVAEPGGVYDIARAEGVEGIPSRPDGPWERVKATGSSDKGKE